MFNFKIAQFKAYSQALINDQQWQQWAYSEAVELPDGERFKANLIPLMQARRMGIADKMAIQAALELNNSIKADAIVFASRHGQLDRTYRVLKHFFQHGEMSPTDFATAVHNAPSGQFSILAKQTSPISSVTSEANTFCAGLLEALLCLQTGKQNVLLIVFDDQVPDFYNPFLSSEERHKAYAFGMLLQQGIEWSLTLQQNNNQTRHNYPDGLIFLREYFRKNPQFHLIYGRQKWVFMQK